MSFHCNASPSLRLLSLLGAFALSDMRLLVPPSLSLHELVPSWSVMPQCSLASFVASAGCFAAVRDRVLHDP